MIEKLVVTRHRNLVVYMKELGLIDDNIRVLSHAQESDVVNKHVLGVVPFWLASHAKKITEIQIRIPREKLGTELSIEDVRYYSLDPKTYSVEEVEFNWENDSE